ncbi:hypothetical protein GPJ56_005725 [Histomonas meleagridis]|uniref:uncharacterized protein n=1 Tax=Histomonas meleagridis TaxID=135588 RepID=UPI00355957FF|nr:hypothetical protein GPJ56_005725 [Histomonas meleagridis]KAH0803339.1 hypothetical protein GO595_003683 [Histomonas meleagridis]
MFASPVFSKNKSLHFIDDEFKMLSTYQIFTNDPPADVHNHPQFINFLQDNIVYAIDFFQTYESPFQSEITHTKRQITENRAKLKDDIVHKKIFSSAQVDSVLNQIDENISTINTLFYAKKTKRHLSACPKSRKYNIPSFIQFKEECKNSVHQIVVDIYNTKEMYQKTKKLLNKEASDLSNEVEKETFAFYINKFQQNNDNKQSMESITEFERILESSRQLAIQIAYERYRLKEEADKLDQGPLHVKYPIYDVLDQVWNVLKQDAETNAKLIEAKRKLYEQSSKLYKLRKEELECNNLEAREKSAQVVLIPNEEQKIAESREKLNAFIEHLELCINDLSSSSLVKREGSPSQKLMRAVRSLKNLQKWTESNKKKVGNAIAPKPRQRTPKSKVKKHRKKMSSCSSTERTEISGDFFEYMGKTNMFLDDVLLSMKRIDSALDIQ